MSQAKPMTRSRRAEVYGRSPGPFTARQNRRLNRSHLPGAPHGATGERIRRPNPRAAHRVTSFWTGPPGECGIECSCGTTLDGFATVRAAEDLHRQHTRPVSTLRGSIATHVAEFCAPCPDHHRPRLHRRPR